MTLLGNDILLSVTICLVCLLGVVVVVYSIMFRRSAHAFSLLYISHQHYACVFGYFFIVQFSMFIYELAPKPITNGGMFINLEKFIQNKTPTPHILTSPPVY